MPASPIRRLVPYAEAAKSSGTVVYHLNIGQPDIATAPAFWDGIAGYREKVLSYSHSAGLASYRQAYAQQLNQKGYGLSADDVLISTGGSEALVMAMMACFDPGDEILIPEPFYANYNGFAAMGGVVLRPFTTLIEENFALPAVEDLAGAVGPKTRAIMICNPNNPTGMVYSKDEIAALAEVLVKYPDTWIIADDIYHRMVFDGLGYHNFIQFHPQLRDRVIFVDSLSKTYGMPGWRVGFIAGPESVAKAITTLNSNHITNIPEVVTAAAVAALTGPQDVPTEKNAEFQHKRDMVMTAMNSIPGLVCPRPQGAFYVFPDISCAFGKSHGGKVIGTDVDFCNALLDAKGVACVPGSAFGEPKSLRISYTCPSAQLPEGLKRFVDFFTELT